MNTILSADDHRRPRGPSTVVAQAAHMSVLTAFVLALAKVVAESADAGEFDKLLAGFEAQTLRMATQYRSAAVTAEAVRMTTELVVQMRSSFAAAHPRPAGHGGG